MKRVRAAAKKRRERPDAGEKKETGERESQNSCIQVEDRVWANAKKNDAEEEP